MQYLHSNLIVLLFPDAIFILLPKGNNHIFQFQKWIRFDLKHSLKGQFLYSTERGAAAQVHTWRLKLSESGIV